MKKIYFISLFLLFSLMSHAENSMKALHCGPRGSFFGALFSDMAIPDYFPPEQSLVRMLIAEPILGDLSSCDEFAPVYFGESCMAHDQCYFTLGANKDACDEDLLLGWQQSCDERYQGGFAASSFCKSACKQAADFMYNALRYDDGSFCPSCVAFENDQAEAQRRASLGR